MTDQLDGAGRPVATSSLADAIARRDALQKQILAQANEPLAALAARVEAADFAGISTDMRALLPLLPEGPGRQALDAASQTLAAAPGMIATLRQLAQLASA